MVLLFSIYFWVWNRANQFDIPNSNLEVLNMKNSEKNMETIVALAKGRGFVYAGSEIYGGLSNTWDYGPLGVELKNNVKKAWWKKFV